MRLSDPSRKRWLADRGYEAQYDDDTFWADEYLGAVVMRTER